MAPATPRERILDSALRLLEQGGASAGSLRAIGAEAGLHNSSLFHHFAGKRAIHDALAERVIGALAARVAPLESDDPPNLGTLVAVLGDLAEALATRPGEAAFLLSVLVTGDAGPLAGARTRAERDLLAPVWNWIVRARDSGAIRGVRPQPTTLQLLGLVLLEPTWRRKTEPAGLRPAARARRRELEAWVRGALAPGAS